MYLINTAKEQRTPRTDDAPIERRKVAASTTADHSGAEAQEMVIDDAFLEGALDISNSNIANIEGDFLDWNEPEIDFDFDDFLKLDANNKTFPYHSSRASSLVRHSSPSTTVHFQEVISARKLSIPTLMEHSVRSYIHLPSTRPGAQGITKLIMHTLKSYPHMMLRYNTLPPFIHQRLVGPHFDASSMEPLTNCISLVHMISSGVRGSRKLFWKNVRMECERLFTEVLISGDVPLGDVYVTNDHLSI